MAVSIHLPYASEQQIQGLMRAVGRSLKSIDITRLSTGDILRLRTMSGNCYILQIIDPINCTANVYRRESRGQAPDGHRGERRILKNLEVGEHLIYRGESDTPSRTTRLTEIVWILDL